MMRAPHVYLSADLLEGETLQDYRSRITPRRMTIRHRFARLARRH